jgi:hypothetical protein
MALYLVKEISSGAETIVNTTRRRTAVNLVAETKFEVSELTTVEAFKRGLNGTPFIDDTDRTPAGAAEIAPAGQEGDGFSGSDLSPSEPTESDDPSKRKSLFERMSDIAREGEEKLEADKAQQGEDSK